MTAHAAPLLECKLSVTAEARPGQPVWLSLELRNSGPKVISVLNWNTPLEGFFGRYLTVRGPDGEVSYQGPMVKRGAPEAEDYVRVQPGRAARARVDLTLVYELKKPGRYEVVFGGHLHDVTETRVTRIRKPDQLTAHGLSCPAASFVLLPG